MGLRAEQVHAAFGSATPSLTADYDVLPVEGADLHVAHLAISRRGFPSLLIPVPRVGTDATRLTHGIAVSAASSVEFARGSERWCCPAAVVECHDPRLVRTFAALVAAVASRLAAGPPPSWTSVSSLFSEWERLLGRRRVLPSDAERGLWGELWCIARSARPLDMLYGWRGPEAERVDFLVDGLGLEVKVGRRAGVHIVSQAQVDEALGDAPVVFMSMHAMVDPLRGRTLPDLVSDVVNGIDDTATFEEKLAAVGYAREDDHAYTKRYVLLEAPSFYSRENIPRVRTADAGVSDLHYQVELLREAAMPLEARSTIINVFGLNEPFSREFPCA